MSASASPSPCTPAEDRLRRRVLRRNAKGETPLHRAAIRGLSVMTEQMLRLSGVDPDEVDNAGWTPLHEACNHGRLAVVKVLLRHGADVNRFGGVGDQRETPLHDAAKGGHLKVVKYLVRKGANLSAKKHNGRTPLDEAKQLVDLSPKVGEVVQFLTEHQVKKLLVLFNMVHTTTRIAE